MNPKFKPETLLAFLTGVAFLSLLAYAALRQGPPLRAEAFFFLRVICALAASGFAAIIPGFLNIELGWLRNSIRAGGALAVFAMVYFLNPPALTGNTPAAEDNAHPPPYSSAGGGGAMIAPGVGSTSAADPAPSPTNKSPLGLTAAAGQVFAGTAHPPKPLPTPVTTAAAIDNKIDLDLPPRVKQELDQIGHNATGPCKATWSFYVPPIEKKADQTVHIKAECSCGGTEPQTKSLGIVAVASLKDLHSYEPVQDKYRTFVSNCRQN